MKHIWNDSDIALILVLHLVDHHSTSTVLVLYSTINNTTIQPVRLSTDGNDHEMKPARDQLIFRAAPRLSAKNSVTDGSGCDVVLLIAHHGRHERYLQLSIPHLSFPQYIIRSPIYCML